MKSLSELYALPCFNANDYEITVADAIAGLNTVQDEFEAMAEAKKNAKEAKKKVKKRPDISDLEKLIRRIVRLISSHPEVLLLKAKDIHPRSLTIGLLLNYTEASQAFEIAKERGRNWQKATKEKEEKRRKLEEKKLHGGGEENPVRFFKLVRELK